MNVHTDIIQYFTNINIHDAVWLIYRLFLVKTPAFYSSLH